MEIDPFAMLEVTLQEETEDDECILVRDDEEEAEGEGQQQAVTEMQPPPEEEVDPLACLQTPSFDTLQNMPHVWVHNSIANLATTTKPEEAYRNATFSSLESVVRKRIHCTVCQHHVGCSVRTHPSSIEHPVLKVLLCQKCSLMYKSVAFVVGPTGKETSCRWCGGLREGASHFKLWTCLNCPFTFCEICVFQNLPVYKRYKKRDDWTCFVCNLRELWPARALLWAVQRYILYLLKNPLNEVIQEGDLSQCCKRKRPFQSQNPANASQGSLSALFQQKKKKQDFTSVFVKTPTGVMKLMNSAGGAMNGSVRVGAGTAVRSVPGRNTPCYQPAPQAQQPLTVRVDWLKSRLKNFTNNIETFAIKLQEMEKGLPVTENLHKVKTTLDTLTSLLELSSNQCRDFKTDLLKEWKAKTDKLLFDRVLTTPAANVSLLKSALTINSNDLANARQILSNGQKASIEAVSGSGVQKQVNNGGRRPSATPSKKPGKGSSSKASDVTIVLSDDEEEAAPPPVVETSTVVPEVADLMSLVKPCYVKLYRLEGYPVGGNPEKCSKTPTADSNPSSSAAPINNQSSAVSNGNSSTVTNENTDIVTESSAVDNKSTTIDTDSCAVDNDKSPEVENGKSAIDSGTSSAVNGEIYFAVFIESPHESSDLVGNKSSSSVTGGSSSDKNGSPSFDDRRPPPAKTESSSSVATNVIDLEAAKELVLRKQVVVKLERLKLELK